VAHNKFQPDTLIEIDGAIYKPLGYINGRHQWINTTTGVMFVCPDADGVMGLPTDADFSRLLGEERLQLKSAEPKNRARFLKDSANWAIEQAIEIDPKVEGKLRAIELLDEAGVPNGNNAIGSFLATAWTAELLSKYGPHLSPRQLRRLRTERGYPGQRRPGQIMSMRGRAQKMSRSLEVPAEVEWKHALSHYVSKGKTPSTYADFVAEMMAINEGRHPTYVQPTSPYRIIDERTFRRRIEALEDSNTTGTKLGKQAVEQDWAGGGSPLVADFAMQYVQIDHTKLDVFVVDDEMQMVLGRAWLTLAIDVKTRAIVAHLISFIDPSVWTVGEILRRMVLPKRPPTEFAKRYPILIDIRGKPMEVIIDNATEFRSHALEAAARGAGFNIRWCPVKKPRYRALVERGVGTLTRMICENLPGCTLPLKDARRLGHNSEEEACVLMMELEAVGNFCVAQYNTTPGADSGRQPAMEFERDANKNGINNFTDLESFRIDTMAIETKAQLSPSGIRAFSGLRYYDARNVRALLDDLVSMEPRRQRRDDATATVDFRYDPNNISFIYVWNRRSRKWVELTCSDERYADGMPIWFHNEIRAEAKRQSANFNTEDERNQAKSRLIAAIKAITPEASAKARKTVAELYEIPRLRQITGNIVHLQSAPAQAVTLLDFLANDRAEETSLDAEILAPRPAPTMARSNQNLAERRAARTGMTSPNAEASQQKQANQTDTRARRRVSGKFNHN
jgi:transposase InsO family protein